MKSKLTQEQPKKHIHCDKKTQALHNRRLISFLEKAEELHGNRYDYSKVVYTGAKNSVTIICQKHGEFKQTPDTHNRSKRPGNCQKCKADTISKLKKCSIHELRAKCRATHGSSITIPDQVYRNSLSPITTVCRLHGGFITTPAKLLYSKHGCNECAKLSTIESSRKPQLMVDFISGLPDKLKDRFTYRSTNDYVLRCEEIAITCNKHNHTFFQSPVHHETGSGGCRYCKGESISRSHSMSLSEFKSKVTDIWGDIYELDETSFTGSKELMRVFCNEETDGVAHGWFKKRPNDLLSGHGCTECNKKTNNISLEDKVRDFINSECGLETHYGDSPTIKDLMGSSVPARASLDILIPKLKVAVEVNGLYWHSDAHTDKNTTYHINKTRWVEAAGWRLIHIWEDDWLLKQSVVKERLKAVLGVDTATIFARKTKLCSPTWKEASKFLSEHHLQGAGVPTKLNYGLSFDGKLVALATFAKVRFGSGGMELMRFCSDCRVVGGFSKLLKAFSRDYSGELVTYADLCWGRGDVYEKCGFEFDGVTNPGYSWVKSGHIERLSRNKFQKHRLHKVLKEFHPELSEAENCRLNGYAKIYDCGNARWRLSL